MLSLARANLAGASLAGANLARANLAGADLVDANLARANLAHNRYVIGCTLTNYQMVMFMHDKQIKVTCGCRRGMTLDEAREHWSPKNVYNWTEKQPSWGEQRLRQLDFLEAEARHLGWISQEAA